MDFRKFPRALAQNLCGGAQGGGRPPQRDGGEHLQSWTNFTKNKFSFILYTGATERSLCGHSEISLQPQGDLSVATDKSLCGHKEISLWLGWGVRGAQVFPRCFPSLWVITGLCAFSHVSAKWAVDTVDEDVASSGVKKTLLKPTLPNPLFFFPGC